MKLGNAGWRLGVCFGRWSSSHGLHHQSYSVMQIGPLGKFFLSISVPWLKQSSYTQKCHRKRKENDDPVWLTDISSHIQWGFRVSEMLQILSWGIKHALETQHVVKAAVVCRSKAQLSHSVLWCPVLLMYLFGAKCAGNSSSKRFPLKLCSHGLFCYCFDLKCFKVMDGWGKFSDAYAPQIYTCNSNSSFWNVLFIFYSVNAFWWVSYKKLKNRLAVE